MTRQTVYDVIVAGGGIGGCRAAIAAAEEGGSVVLIESETFLGYEIAATLSPWITDDASTLGAFAPLFEGAEAYVAGERAFCLGTFKKRLLEVVRQAGVTVIFASGVAGVVRDDGEVAGVVIGNKSGLQVLLGRSLIDATPLQHCCRLAGATVKAPGLVTASFACEYSQVQETARLARTVDVDPALGLQDDVVELHPIPGEKGLTVLRFGLQVDLREDTPPVRNALEVQAREKVCELGQYLVAGDGRFREAILGRLALRVAAPSPEVSDLPGGVFSLPPHVWPSSIAAIEMLAMKVARLALEQPGYAAYEERQVDFGGCPITIEDLNPRLEGEENFLGLSYSSLQWPPAELLPALSAVDVCVAGGGTSGAPAAITAAGEGVSVALVEASAALGGTGCAGGINTYYHGWRGAFTGEVDVRVRELAERLSPGNDLPPQNWNISVKELALLAMLRSHGGEVWLHCQTLAPICESGRVQGLIVLGSHGLAVVRSRVCIDATGDGDVAVRAGAPTTMADPRGGNVQTFNQCNWLWQPNRNGYNTDLGVIDNRDFIDTTRGIMVAHQHAFDFDFSPMPVVRESRHVRGDYIFSLRDIFAPRHYPDTISRLKTDFDQHGLQGSAFARMGFLPYHTIDYTARIPYRICLPQAVEGLLVAAKAISATQEGFSFLRMQPDMQNLGAAVGVAAALAVESGHEPRDIDRAELQKRLLVMGTIEAEDLAGEGVTEPDFTANLLGVLAGREESLLPLLCAGQATVLPLLREAFAETQGEARRLAAMALAWFGDAAGVPLLLERLEALRELPQSSDWDSNQRPTGGFTGKPSTYWQLNQVIVLLGLAENRAAIKPLASLAAKTEAGGPVNENKRLHWRRIPNYDRIVSLCFALERLADPAAVPALERLIDGPGIGGFADTCAADADQQYPSALLEVMIARTLARCSGTQGAIRLVAYLQDTRRVLSTHARDELIVLTGQDFGFTTDSWLQWLASHHLPVSPYTACERF